MKNNHSPIQTTKSVTASSELLTDADIELLLFNQKAVVRNIDRDVTDLLRIKHKLKQTQQLKDKTIILERSLSDIYDFIEDKILEAPEGDDVSFKQRLLKQCEQLITRNERVKKNLTDDMAACRYIETKEAIDPIKVSGYLAGFPITAAALTKTFFSNKPDVILHAAEIGEVFGVLLSFHRQAKRGWDIAARNLSKTPQQIKKSVTLQYLKKNVRNCVIGMAWTFSVHAKKITTEDIQHPTRSLQDVKTSPKTPEC